MHPLCNPIILFVNKLNIGPPEEPLSVLHKCFISYSLIVSIPVPYETEALSPFGKCKMYIGSSL